MNKRDSALQLAEEILSDIELSRIKPVDIARKTSRLARLTDDFEAILWLHFEVAGYPEGGNLDQLAWTAAQKSNRVYKNTTDDKSYARTAGLGQLLASIESAEKQLSVSGGGNYFERGNLRSEMVNNQAILDKVVGSIHSYVSMKYQELRFGAVVQTAFDLLRSKVDSRISELVPNALPILTTALENANDDNPVQWENAAKACRDLIKTTADSLRPAGNPVNGRSMTDANYVNRLMDWIESNNTSKTLARISTSELDDLGKRLDAVTTSGNKGAHTKVRKEDASRYIVGTYLLLGDILDLKPTAADSQPPKDSGKSEPKKPLGKQRAIKKSQNKQQ